MGRTQKNSKISTNKADYLSLEGKEIKLILQQHYPIEQKTKIKISIISSKNRKKIPITISELWKKSKLMKI
jgi:hypothetical protein